MYYCGMERFQMLFTRGMKAKLEKRMSKYGFTKIAPFLRYIIIKFLDNEV